VSVSFVVDLFLRVQKRRAAKTSGQLASMLVRQVATNYISQEQIPHIYLMHVLVLRVLNIMNLPPIYKSLFTN